MPQIYLQQLKTTVLAIKRLPFASCSLVLIIGGFPDAEGAVAHVFFKHFLMKAKNIDLIV